MDMRLVAVVHCSGGSPLREGVDPASLPPSCDDILGAYPLGTHTCRFGCLGGGTCVAACPRDAISVGDDGVAHVDAGICDGCGECVSACPQQVITLVPRGDDITVRCSNHEKVLRAFKNCENVCIGCRTCERVCPVEAIHVEDFLAKIDYDLCVSCGMCATRCPLGIIHDANGLLASR